MNILSQHLTVAHHLIVMIFAHVRDGQRFLSYKTNPTELHEIEQLQQEHEEVAVNLTQVSDRGISFEFRLIAVDFEIRLVDFFFQRNISGKRGTKEDYIRPDWLPRWQRAS